MSGEARVEIGEFRFDPTTGELNGPTGTVRLRAQAARSLWLLAKRAGVLVTREELRRDIWGDTHVDFEQGLNTCIKEVRVALGDSAEAPRYVETLPRRGYRLIAPVRWPGSSRPPSQSASSWLRAAAVFACLLIIGSSRSHTLADPEIDRLLALGRHLLRTRDPGALERGLRLLDAAAARSPRDARVWSALADLHRVLAERDPSQRPRHRSIARYAATHALELDPGLAAGHASLAGVLEDEGSIGAAEAEFRRAVALDFSEPAARQGLSALLRRQGRLDEAYLHARAARAADPLSAGACTNLGYVHLLRGDLGPARAAFEEALSIEPGFAAARLGLARAHMAAQDWDAALTALEHAGLPPDVTQTERAYALARSGRTVEARRLLRQLADQPNRRVYDIAAIHASLGDRDQALLWLETAIASRVLELRALPADPRFEALRGEPRFAALLERVSGANGGAQRPARRPGA